ncbi:unnamed protein product [Acanthoscelides obtectus]|uniref:Uncharacterized protein n=1 Tax=Acanthoscelides obtectus TaxID=200917 RepID=A0A9P0LIG6_ACAOB|nr:unnamed protein product [Acanthoscelides obtectus]CAK1634905.1 hypothetical protein AOBTE_LOCUS8955 [Acanthoscelides obtectus]
MKDFEEVSYLPHIKYIDTIAEEFKNRFSDFKKIESDISPLTISAENVSRADLKLELCDLQSDPFYQGRTEINDGKHESLRKQLFQHEIYQVKIRAQALQRRLFKTLADEIDLTYGNYFFTLKSDG